MTQDVLQLPGFRRHAELDPAAYVDSEPVVGMPEE
jgi:hypothetical protein